MKPLAVPRITANEDVVEVVEVRARNNVRCSRGDTLCLLQSTKATFSLDAEEDGHVWMTVGPGDRVSVGQVIGFLDQAPIDPGALPDTGGPASGEVTPTRKAQELLDRHGIDPRAIRQQGVLRAADVEEWLRREEQPAPASDPGWDALHAIMRDDAPGDAGPSEVARLKAALAWLQETYTRRWHRTIPTPDILFDRWATAERLGFGEGSNISHLSYVFGDVKVGRQTFVGPFTVLDGSGGLEIGDHCSIAAGVHIYSHDTIARALSGHRAPITHAPTRIGHCCFLGANAVITKGVTIGDHCLIAANTVITSDVAPHSVMQGSPARQVGRVSIDGEGRVTLTR